MTATTPASEPHLLDALSDGVLRLTMNRPGQRNAVSPEMICRLSDAWSRARSDADVRLVVLTGAGSAFSAGADLKVLIPLLSGQRKAEDDWDERVLTNPQMAAHAFLRHEAFPKPVVAAVNGVATGGGLELLLATHIRIAGAGASFGLSEVKRGLIPGGGGVARLPRQIPPQLAFEMLLTGDLITSERAASFGLINEVVPDDELASRTSVVASAIAANGPMAVRLILETVAASEGLPLSGALELEDAAFAAAIATQDAAEGARAFAEKRPPRFVGH